MKLPRNQIPASIVSKPRRTVHDEWPSFDVLAFMGHFDLQHCLLSHEATLRAHSVVSRMVQPSRLLPQVQGIGGTRSKKPFISGSRR